MFSWSSSRRGAGLLLEAAHALRVAGRLRRQDLEGHDAAEFEVAGLEHRGHAARADRLDQLEVPESPAHDRGHVTGDWQRRWGG